MMQRGLTKKLKHQNNNDVRNTIYLVSVFTRGLPASDLQEGFEERACYRE
jgi:hypothetical protein